MIGFLLVAAVFNTAFSQEDNPCPSPSSIDPCYCTNDTSYHFIVKCERIDDMQQVRKVLSATSGRRLALYFEKTRFGDIPSDLFQGQLADTLDFSYCDISSFGDRPFSGLEDSLQKIDVYRSVNNLETFSLGHLRNLHSLMFQGNKVRRVGNDWFRGDLSGLKHLSLENNDIKEIGDRAFVPLEGIDQLWISENPIGAVSRSMLPNPASHLSVLEMRHCKLSTIPEDLFTGMPNLQIISVAGNSILTLPEGTWGPVWNNLEEVDVDENPIVCDHRLSWIFHKALPDVFGGECDSPSWLQGKKLADLTANDLQY